MSEKLTDDTFESVSKRVKEAYDEAAAEFKEKVAKAKSEALKKIG